MDTFSSSFGDLWKIDFESTVKEFEFTKNAAREYHQVIESDDFRDMDSNTIFTYLYRKMKIIVFRDHLKRYIYERAALTEPFINVPEEVYREIVAFSFEENQTPFFLEPNSTKQTAMIKGWLRQDRVRRDIVFLLGFGLRMNDEDVSMFLTKALQEDDFHFNDPKEAAYWYCYRNGLRYKTAHRLLEHAAADNKAERQTEVQAEMAPSCFTSVGSVRQALELGLDKKENMIRYLKMLGTLDESVNKQEKTYRLIRELLDRSKEEVVRLWQTGRIYGQDDPGRDKAGKENNGKNAREKSAWKINTGKRRGREKNIRDKQDVTAADLERYILSGIPRTENRNLQKSSRSLLSRQFRGYRLSRQRIDGLIKEQVQPDRYDIITLEFFLHAQKENILPEERCRIFMAETNRMLEECGMMKLYPVNPYDAFVMMCLVSDYPPGTWSDVWEMSYEE